MGLILEVTKGDLLKATQLQGVAWKNPELHEMVYTAVAKDDVLKLSDIINDQALCIVKLKDQVRALYAEVQQLKSEQNAQIEQTVTVVSKSNAYRDDLDTDKMWELYQKDRSYSKVGRRMGCDSKTVKHRLIAAGYVV